MSISSVERNRMKSIQRHLQKKKKVSQKKRRKREKGNVTNEMALDLPTIDQTKRVTPDTIQYPTACKIP